MIKSNTAAAAKEMLSGSEKSKQWVGIHEVAPYMVLGGGLLFLVLSGFLAIPPKVSLAGMVAGVGVIVSYLAYFYGEEGVGYVLIALFSIPAVWFGLAEGSGLGGLESLAFFGGCILSVGFLSMVLTWWFRKRRDLEIEGRSEKTPAE